MRSVRKMKNVLLFSAIMIAPLAMAQGEHHKHKDPTERAEARTARMTEELSLTADQAEKVKQINQQHAEKMQVLHGQELPKEEKKAKMKEIKDQHRDELRSVLTKEQIARMDELKKERKAQRDQGRSKDR